MTRILVLQHVAYEILGTLDPLFRSHGTRIRYVNFGREPEARPSIEGYDGLVVLGGPMNVGEVEQYPHLETEIEVIGEALQAEIPVLGICLGAQLLARALGAEVQPAADKEIGWHDVRLSDDGRKDPLFEGFEPVERIFHWHGDAFDIPAGSVHLASSELCSNQAFRHGTSAYGLQFHLEVDESLVERWLGVPHHQRELAALGGKVDAERIRDETRRHIARLQWLSDRAFTRFIELFGDLRRRPDHPHR